MKAKGQEQDEDANTRNGAAGGKSTRQQKPIVPSCSCLLSSVLYVATNISAHRGKKSLSIAAGPVLGDMVMQLDTASCEARYHLT